MAALMVGLLGAGSSAVAGLLGCCAADRPEKLHHCQWMIPTACCDESLSVAASNVVPHPAVVGRFRAPLLAALETLHVAGACTSISPYSALLATVVLRL